MSSQKSHILNSMKFFKLVMNFTVGAVLISCGQAPAENRSQSEDRVENPKVFTVAGIVKELDGTDSSMVVAHEEIPDFMPAMIMPFKVRDRKELTGLQPGDSVTFRLSVTDSKSWIDQIKKKGSTPLSEIPARKSIRVVREVEPLNVGDLLPNYRFTNELGRAVSFEDYKGKALALTFIFTRCPIPEFCPRMSLHFTAVQNELSASQETPKNWHMFSISFDPHFDTPAILRGYGKIYGYNPKHWSFVTGSMIDIDAITEQFGLPVVQQGGTLSHKLRTVVVDSQGRVQNIFIGNQWKPEELTEAMIKATGSAPVTGTSTSVPEKRE